MKIEVYDFLAENPLKIQKTEVESLFSEKCAYIEDKDGNAIRFLLEFNLGKIVYCVAKSLTLRTDDFKKMYMDVADAAQQSVLSKNSQQIAVFLHMRKMSLI